MPRTQGQANDGARFPFRGFVNAFGEARVFGNIGNDLNLAVLRDPARDAFAHLEAQVLDRLRSFPDGDGEIEFVALLVHHEQGPGVRAEELSHLLHDRLQDRVELQRRRQRFRDVVEDAELLQLLAFRCGGFRHPSPLGTMGSGCSIIGTGKLPRQ